MATRGKVYVYGRGDKVPEGVVCFNVTSRSKEVWCRNFSPFFIGPVEVCPFDKVFLSLNFENAWQYLKLYEKMSESEYMEWASSGWSSKEAKRFPMGRGAKPLCSLLKGKRLSYIEARFYIYAPLYAFCLEKYANEELGKLKKILDEGRDIALFDFDGYNHRYNECSLEDVLYNSRRKMGHAFVIAMLLENEKIWEGEFDKAKIHKKSMKRSK